MSDPRVEPPPDPEVLAALAAAGLSYRTEQQALICTPCKTAISKKSAIRHLRLQHPSIEKSVQLAAAAALKTIQPIDPNKLPVPAAIVPAVDFLSSLGPGWREGQAFSMRCCQAVARGSGGAGVNLAVKMFICALMRFPDLFARAYARVQEVLPGFKLPEPNLNSARPPREWMEESNDMRLEGFKVYKGFWLVIALLGL
ncbi:hypothetical protein OC834_007084 [Tilletia horrida]|nr:hypothetical protein OC834_007084 [Tilletia horrida]